MTPGAHDLDQLKALNPRLGSRKNAVDCESPMVQKRERRRPVYRGKYSLEGRRVGFSCGFSLLPCGLICFISLNIVNSKVEGTPPYPFSVSP